MKSADKNVNKKICGNKNWDFFSGKGARREREQRLKGGFQSCADMLSPQGGAREPGRPDLNIVHSPQDRLRRRAQRSQVTSALSELSPENLTDRGEYLRKSMRMCEIDQLLLGEMAFTDISKRKQFQDDQMDIIDSVCEKQHNSSTA